MANTSKNTRGFSEQAIEVYRAASGQGGLGVPGLVHKSDPATDQPSISSALLKVFPLHCHIYGGVKEHWRSVSPDQNGKARP